MKRRARLAGRVIHLSLWAGLLASQAAGHDLWAESLPDGPRLMRGHAHSSHAGADQLPIDPAWLLELRCVTADGDVQVGTDPGEGFPRLPCDGPAVQAVISTGYWTKTPEGSKNISGSQAEHPIRSWISYESATLLTDWHARLSSPLGAYLEVVPLANPLVIKPKEKLAVRVTLAGEPVEGAIVTYAGKPRGTTGRDGKLNIRLREAGFQMIQASLARPSTDPEADEVVHTAALCFELKE